MGDMLPLELLIYGFIIVAFLSISVMLMLGFGTKKLIKAPADTHPHEIKRRARRAGAAAGFAALGLAMMLGFRLSEADWLLFVGSGVLLVALLGFVSYAGEPREGKGKRRK